MIEFLQNLLKIKSISPKDGFIDKIIEQMMKENEMIDFCLVGEPTSTKKVADCARIGRRGSLGGHLKILGKQGHIAYPEKVINPILQSGDLISKLNKKSTLSRCGLCFFFTFK